MTNRVTFTTACGDCGEEFSGHHLFGLNLGRYCARCREARNTAHEEERRKIAASSLAYRQHEWLTDSLRGIPGRYRGLTWDDFRFDRGGEGNRRRVDALRQYAQEIPVDRFPHHMKSIVLASEHNGVGKTMLASLMLNDIIHRYTETGRERPPFQFWSVHDAKMRLRSAERFGGPETPEEVYRDFGTVWLLILDDVGKEQLTGAEASFAYEMYFAILNQRYNNQLPVILTSNLSFSPWRFGGPSLVDLMGRASVSRLVEMTGRQVYVIEGEDRR